MYKRQPLALFGINPTWVGQKPKYVLGKKSGLASITMKLEDLGMPDLPDEKKLEILNKVKMLSLKKKGLVNDDEFIEIVKEVNKK